MRTYLSDPGEWHRFPEDVRQWLEVQQRRSILPGPDWTLATGVFFAMVAWQAVCVVYHAARTVQFFNVVKGSSPA